jgi:hypothetical protein
MDEAENQAAPSTSARISNVLDEIRATEKKRDMILDYMKKVGMKTYARPTTIDNRVTDVWDEYHELGNVLQTLQLRLSSLLQESTKEATEQLNKNVQTLNSTTSRLFKSSRTLETLTLFLIALTALSAGYGFFGPENPYRFYYSILFLVLLVVMAIWVVFWGRESTKEASSPDNTNR